MDYAADFFVASRWTGSSLPRRACSVRSRGVALKSLILRFGILVGDPFLRAADHGQGFQDCVIGGNRGS